MNHNTSKGKRCKICNVKMAQPWPSGICVLCDFNLGSGMTEEDIKEQLYPKEATE